MRRQILVYLRHLLEQILLLRQAVLQRYVTLVVSEGPISEYQYMFRSNNEFVK